MRILTYVQWQEPSPRIWRWTQSHKYFGFFGNKGDILPFFLSVPDSKSRNIPEVVSVRRWAVGVLGIWKGRGSWVKGGANGVSLQATWDRGGRFLSQLGGCQVSRRGYKGETKGSQQGERKARGVAPCIYVTVLVYVMEWLDDWMMPVIVYIIIIIGINVGNNLNSV